MTNTSEKTIEVRALMSAGSWDAGQPLPEGAARRTSAMFDMLRLAFHEIPPVSGKFNFCHGSFFTYFCRPI